MDDYNADVAALVNFNRQSSIQVPIPTREQWMQIPRTPLEHRSITEWDQFEQTMHAVVVLQ